MVLRGAARLRLRWSGAIVNIKNIPHPSLNSIAIKELCGFENEQIIFHAEVATGWQLDVISTTFQSAGVCYNPNNF